MTKYQINSPPNLSRGAYRSKLSERERVGLGHKIWMAAVLVHTQREREREGECTPPRTTAVYYVFIIEK